MLQINEMAKCLNSDKPNTKKAIDLSSPHYFARICMDSGFQSSLQDQLSMMRASEESLCHDTIFLFKTPWSLFADADRL